MEASFQEIDARTFGLLKSFVFERRMELNECPADLLIVVYQDEAKFLPEFNEYQNKCCAIFEEKWSLMDLDRSLYASGIINQRNKGRDLPFVISAGFLKTALDKLAPHEGRS